MTKEEYFEIGKNYLQADLMTDGSFRFYADETFSNYIISKQDLADLGEALENEKEYAYSHWADGRGEEVEIYFEKNNNWVGYINGKPAKGEFISMFASPIEISFPEEGSISIECTLTNGRWNENRNP